VSLLSRGNSTLERKRGAATARDVSYTRGVLAATFKATPNRLTSEQITDAGIGIRLDEWDWIIRAADLAAFNEPEPGDLIRDTDAGGVVHVYIVAGNAGEPVWRYADEDRRAVRVHSKFQRTE